MSFTNRLMPLNGMTLTPRVSLSLRARNKKTNWDSGEHALSFGSSMTLLEAVGALAAAFFALKMILFLYRGWAVRKTRRTYRQKLAAAKRRTAGKMS